MCGMLWRLLLLLATQVTALSTTTVPRGVPALSEITLHLPKGIFNLTITLNSKTKGINPIDISIVDVKSSVDQDSLIDYRILRPNARELIYQPSSLTLNSEASERSVVFQVAFAAETSAASGPASAYVTVAAVAQPLQLNLTILPGQALIVTPEISVLPYEDEKAFDERGLLGFGILVEMPGGACTKAMRIEVSGHFSGLGDGRPRLCAASFAAVDSGLPRLAATATDAADTSDIDGVALATRELGPLCSAPLNDSAARQTATYRVAFLLASPSNSSVDGEVRMSGRVWLGGNALWSGGVAVRVHRVFAPAATPAAVSCFSTCAKLTCPTQADKCVP